MSKKANSVKFPEITDNNEQSHKFVCCLDQSIINDIVTRSKDLRASVGLPPALSIKLSAYRLGSDVRVLAEFEGGTLERIINNTNGFKGNLKAKPETVRAVTQRKKADLNEVTGEVPRKNITRWDNVPPKEQRDKRNYQMPEKLNAPAVVPPPLLPPGYAVTGNKGTIGEALTNPEYHVLTEYVYRKIHSLSTPKVQDFNNDGFSEFCPKTPLNEWQRQQMDYCSFMEQGLPQEHLDELNAMIAACCQEHGISLEDLGLRISGTKCPKEQVGVVKGYFKAVAQLLLRKDIKYRRSGRFKSELFKNSAERIAS